jgi:hypothetical protein
MFGFLKTLKNKGRRYLFGNRGKWNAPGATRRLNNGSSAKRTLLGRIKNKAGDFLFGTRQNRKLSGKLKNSLEAFIEERIPGLGLTKSRQHELTRNESRAIFAQQAAREAAAQLAEIRAAVGAAGVGLEAQPHSPRTAAALKRAEGRLAAAEAAADIFPGLRSERGGMVWHENPLIQARRARARQAPPPSERV